MNFRDILIGSEFFSLNYCAEIDGDVKDEVNDDHDIVPKYVP